VVRGLGLRLAGGLRRAEIWTVAGGADYTGKPRPAVIVQDDRFDTDSVTICPFTTDPTEAPLFRLDITPSRSNGLRESSRFMVDKITTVRRSRLGEQLGILDDADVIRVNRAMVVFLGIASAEPT
jgi:mRNA interferase MazF